MTTHQISLQNDLSGVFEKYFDEGHSQALINDLEERIRKFSIAIQLKYGYYAVLRKTQSEIDPSIWIFYVDIREAGQSYVFTTNGIICEVQIYKEAF